MPSRFLINFMPIFNAHQQYSRDTINTFPLRQLASSRGLIFYKILLHK